VVLTDARLGAPPWPCAAGAAACCRYFPSAAQRTVPSDTCSTAAPAQPQTLPPHQCQGAGQQPVSARSTQPARPTPWHQAVAAAVQLCQPPASSPQGEVLLREPGCALTWPSAAVVCSAACRQPTRAPIRCCGGDAAVPRPPSSDGRSTVKEKRLGGGTSPGRSAGVATSVAAWLPTPHTVADDHSSVLSVRAASAALRRRAATARARSIPARAEPQQQPGASGGGPGTDRTASHVLGVCFRLASYYIMAACFPACCLVHHRKPLLQVKRT